VPPQQRIALYAGTRATVLYYALLSTFDRLASWVWIAVAHCYHVYLIVTPLSHNHRLWQDVFSDPLCSNWGQLSCARPTSLTFTLPHHGYPSPGICTAFVFSRWLLLSHSNDLRIASLLCTTVAHYSLDRRHHALAFVVKYMRLLPYSAASELVVILVGLARRGQHLVCVLRAFGYHPFCGLVKHRGSLVCLG
jgi:hypothetical protein